MASVVVDSAKPDSNLPSKPPRRPHSGKQCVVMFCDNVHIDGEISLHQFPANQARKKEWIRFVNKTRDPRSWDEGKGEICSKHFRTPDDFQNWLQFEMGYSTKALLTKTATPSVHPVPSEQQLSDARKKRASLKRVNVTPSLVHVSTRVQSTPKRPRRSRVLQKRLVNEVSCLYYYA